MKKQLLSILLCSSVLVFAAPQEQIPTTFFSNRAREIVGMWNGVTPSWLALPTGIAAAGATAAGIAQLNPNICMPFTFVDNFPAQTTPKVTALAIGATVSVGAFFWYKVRKHSPEQIAQRASFFIQELQAKKIASELLYPGNEGIVFGDCGALTSGKYPLLIAANVLKQLAFQIEYWLTKCNAAVDAVNPNKVDLQNQLKQLAQTLQQYKNLVYYNLNYVVQYTAKGTNQYHEQLSLVQADTSAQAQMIQAQAVHSSKNLAWLAWFGHILFKFIEIPKKLIIG